MRRGNSTEFLFIVTSAEDENETKPQTSDHIPAATHRRSPVYTPSHPESHPPRRIRHARLSRPWMLEHHYQSVERQRA